MMDEKLTSYVATLYEAIFQSRPTVELLLDQRHREWDLIIYDPKIDLRWLMRIPMDGMTDERILEFAKEFVLRKLKHFSLTKKVVELQDEVIKQRTQKERFEKMLRYEAFRTLGRVPDFEECKFLGEVCS